MTTDNVVEGVCIAASEDKQNLSTLGLTKYRFYAQAMDQIPASTYKGSAFHGGFGHALKAISPLVYQYLYQPPFKGDPPRPYILTPPLGHKKSYLPSEVFSFDLVLIGPATQHAPICFAAFEKLGSELGLGREKAKFKLTQIDFFNANNTPQTLYKNKQWQFVDAVVNADDLSQSKKITGSTITLDFTSYLRLKNKGKLVNTAPDFRLLMDRLLGRICTLNKYYGKGETLILHRAERDKLLEKAENIHQTNNDLKWQDWTRYSGRQQTEMQFGGLVGSIQYSGELDVFIPYLMLGQWLHVGGKTSFGLGGYALVTE